MKRGRKNAAEPRSYMEIPTENQEVAVTIRENPPSHYMLRVESFSMLSQLVSQIQEKKYETEVFGAGGYKWRLALHPSGDKQKGGDGHISLYLKIVETNTLPAGWVVDVNFKLFVYDHIRDKYYIYPDSNGKVRRFHAMRTEWGFPKLLRLEDFNNVSNGFLLEDTCIFGAEVFVIKYTGHGECLSTKKSAENRYTWKIDKFSHLNSKRVESNRFTAAEHEWTLLVDPQGCAKASGEHLSVFLMLKDLPQGKLVCAQFTLLIRDQDRGKHVSYTGAASSFNFKTQGWGFPKFMSLKDLNDPSKCFIVNDTLIVEVTVNDVSFRVKNLT